MSLALEGVCETLGLRLTSVHPDRIVESGSAWPGGSGSRRAGSDASWRKALSLRLPARIVSRPVP